MESDRHESNRNRLPEKEGLRNERPAPPRPPPLLPRLLASARAAPVTVAFLSACVALFAVAEWHGSTTDTATLIRFGALDRGDVWAGQVWRLVTAAFLHVGLVHLLWNLVGMFGWCTFVEGSLGSGRFAVLYLAAAVAASASSLVFHDVVSAGASGAGFAMIGAWVTLLARKLGSWRALARDGQARRVLGSALVWTVVLSTMNVDNAAHGGGFVAGIALTWALSEPARARPASRRWAWLLAVACVVVPAALALIPRPGLTRFGARALEAHVAARLERGELDEAEEALGWAEKAGYRTPALQLDRAVLLERRGDVERAGRAYQEACSAGDARACTWLKQRPTP